MLKSSLTLTDFLTGCLIHYCESDTLSTVLRRHLFNPLLKGLLVSPAVIIELFISLFSLSTLASCALGLLRLVSLVHICHFVISVLCLFCYTVPSLLPSFMLNRCFLEFHFNSFSPVLNYFLSDCFYNMHLKLSKSV